MSINPNNYYTNYLDSAQPINWRLPFTLMFWWRRETTDARAIWYSGDNVDDDTEFYDNGSGLELITQKGGAYNSCGAYAPATLTEWAHYCARRTSDTSLKYYVNGSLTEIGTVTEDMSLRDNPTSEQLFHWEGGDTGKGDMLGYKCWSRALSNREYLTEYQYLRAVSRQGLWRETPFNNFPSRLTDLSGKARHWTEHGTIIRGPDRLMRYEPSSQRYKNIVVPFAPAVIGSTFELKLDIGVDPSVHTEHTLKVVANGTLAGLELQVDVYCGSTFVTVRTIALTTDSATYPLLLTEAEAALITDYADIHVKGTPIRW